MMFASLSFRSALRWLLPVLIVLFSWLFVASASAAGWIAESFSGSVGSFYSVDFSGSFGAAGADSSTIATSSDEGKSWTAHTVGFGSYYGIEVLGSTSVLAVGTSGDIYKSTDSGATWTEMTSGTSSTLRAIDMISTTTGWVVGDGGKILKTTDGGVTWTTQTSGTTSSLWSVSAASSSVAWASGNSGTILKTTDGGTTWVAQTSGTTYTIRTIDVVSTTAAWAGTTSGATLKTTDGTTWSSSTISGVTYIYDLDFYSSSEGLLTAGSTLYETSDGGASWTSISMLDPAAGSFMDVWNYAGTNNRRAVGSSAQLYRYDGEAPTAVTDLFASTGTTDNTPALSWTAAEDGESLLSYELSIDGGSYSSVGASNFYTLTTALADGSHTLSVRAADEAQNYGTADSIVVSIEASGPSVGYVTPSSVTVNESVTLQVIPTDATGVASCTLTVDGVAQGAMSVSGGTYSRAYTFTSAGTATASATCTDTLGNVAVGPDTTITVSSGPDTTAPTVGSVSPTTATAGSALTLSATYSDAVGVTSCVLYIGGTSQGGMTLSAGTASASYTFSTAGTYSAYVLCTDAASNSGTGTATTITVAAAAEAEATTDTETTVDEPTTEEVVEEAVDDSEVAPGSLLKLACADGADVNDPCKAVYFYSATDGQRHAFPNEKVYFTWYSDFDAVVVVSADFMSSLSLGKNVTYHPGTRMVKFITVNTVYAVAQGGVLRAIASEDVATSLYGATWNQQIDDISDAFYGNYTFGDAIEVTADYDIASEQAATTTIDDNL